MSRSNLSSSLRNDKVVGGLPLLVLGHDHPGGRERHLELVLLPLLQVVVFVVQVELRPVIEDDSKN